MRHLEGSNMYIPVVKKITYKQDLLVERTLPTDGKLTVSIGDIVEPFNKLGTCKVTYEVMELGEKFHSHKKHDSKNPELSFFHEGELVGHLGINKFIAPFDGNLDKSDGKLFVFKSLPKDYWLLPGVWGVVKDVSFDRSVLIKTQAVDLHVPISTGKNKAGELIVFPNPSELLAAQYFTNYLKTGLGKIVYVGHKLTMEIAEVAQSLNVSALLAGGTDKDVFDYCAENNISVGIFTGFGEVTTPDFIFDFLNNISNRYVFFHSNRHILQIPIPSDVKMEFSTEGTSILRFVKKGLKVQVFNSANFGQFGVIDRVLKSSIFVKLDGKDQVIEVTPPNILAIE